MTELFKNIPPKRRQTIADIVINSTVLGKTPVDAANILVSYRNLLSKEEQKFLDFFLSFYKEVKKNDHSSN